MKKSSTSTALVIPAAITPKPSKTDIINAIVERARVKSEEDWRVWKEKSQSLNERIEVAALGEFKRNQPSPNYEIRKYDGEEQVKFIFIVKSPGVTALIKELRKLEHPGYFDEAKTRRKIRDGMNSQKPSGVLALLNNPEAVKMLDASLEAIGA